MASRCHERATKRGEARTPLDGEYDVLICGASFAGLAVARELAGSGARALIVDRYDIGERQTSACAAPTEWLEAMGVAASMRQTFDTLVVHTPHTRVDFQLPWTFSTFDYRELCGLLFEQCDAEFETAKINGRATSSASPAGVRGSAEVRLITIDTIAVSSPPRSSSTLSGGSGCSPATSTSRPTRRSRAGSRFTRTVPRDELEIWIDRGYVPAGYAWSFPAARRGADRRRLVRPAVPRQGADRAPRRGPRLARRSATRATGSRTSCAPRPRTASSSSATPPATACR